MSPRSRYPLFLSVTLALTLVSFDAFARATPECESVEGYPNSVYASVLGSYQGDGTAEAPYDIWTALDEALAYNQRLVLCEGVFAVQELDIDDTLVITGAGRDETVLTSTRPATWSAVVLSQNASVLFAGMTVLGATSVPTVEGVGYASLGTDAVAIPGTSTWNLW